MRRFVTAAFAAASLLVCASTASAQTNTSIGNSVAIGVRGGFQQDPNQFYFGLHVETPHIWDQIHFKPNVELGLGNNERLLALNGEFIYRVPIKDSNDWSIYGGGGPAVIVRTFERPGDDVTDTGGGLNLLVGAEYSKGFFTEIKVGFWDSPSFKFGVGWTFR